jgi:hypothetical protein
MTIDLFAVGDGEKHTIAHDLNFMKPRYEAKHEISFKNPKPNLIDVLRRSGPVPGDANRAQTDTDASDAEKPSNKGLRQTHVSITPMKTRRGRRTECNEDTPGDRENSNNDAAVQSLRKTSPNKAISSPRTPNVANIPKKITGPRSIYRTPLPAHAATPEIPSATARLEGDPTEKFIRVGDKETERTERNLGGESVAKYVGQLALQQPAPSRGKRLSLPSHMQSNTTILANSSLETTTTSLEVSVDTTPSKAAENLLALEDKTETGQIVHLRQRGCSLPHASPEHAASTSNDARCYSVEQRNKRQKVKGNATYGDSRINRETSSDDPKGSEASQEHASPQKIISDEVMDLTAQGDSTPATRQSVIRPVVDLLREGAELSSFAILECLTAVGFDEATEILDPVVTSNPLKSYRTHTQLATDQIFVILPIYHRNHWMVGVANIQNGCIYFYDSLGGTIDPDIEQRIKEHLAASKIALPKLAWTFVPSKSALQDNEKDCGIFAIVNALLHICGMHNVIAVDGDTWRKIFAKMLEKPIVPTLDSLESAAEILAIFKKTLADTRERLVKIESESALEKKTLDLKNLESLLFEIQFPKCPGFNSMVDSEKHHLQEKYRERRLLVAQIKKQEAMMDVIQPMCKILISSIFGTVKQLAIKIGEEIRDDFSAVTKKRRRSIT